MRMGLREANRRFSKVVKAVKAGREVVITDRGRPIAVIKSIGRARASDAAIRELEEAGRLRRAAKSRPMPPWSVRPIKGTPVAKSIEQERNAR